MLMFTTGVLKTSMGARCNFYFWIKSLPFLQLIKDISQVTFQNTRRQRNPIKRCKKTENILKLEIMLVWLSTWQIEHCGAVPTNRAESNILYSFYWQQVYSFVQIKVSAEITKYQSLFKREGETNAFFSRKLHQCLF